MTKLEKAKEIIKEWYRFARCGIYDTRNIAGDIMDTLYEDEGLTIDICHYYSYFEVFGLGDEEFEELKEYYNSLSRKE